MSLQYLFKNQLHLFIYFYFFGSAYVLALRVGKIAMLRTPWWSNAKRVLCEKTKTKTRGGGSDSSCEQENRKEIIKKKIIGAGLGTTMTKSQPCNLKGWTRGGVDKGWFTLYVKN
jgi:hypothetical protein